MYKSGPPYFNIHFQHTMAHVNQVLSKELHVKPLMKDQVAVYRLIDADKDDLSIADIKGTPRKRSPGYLIAGRKKIFDPIKGETVTIENTTTEKTIDTVLGPITKKRPEPIRFTSQKPAITVRHDQPETYAFMERLDENQDNPYRNTRGKVKPLFYRVDPRKKVMKENEVREFRLEALNWVYKEASYTELKACAEKAMQIRGDVKIRVDYKEAEASHGFEMLKRELGALAETDPHTVIKGSTKTEAIMKMQIKDCTRFQIIIFDEKNRTWFHNNKDLTKICDVPPLQNIEESLIKFFAAEKDGGKHYAKMLDTLTIFLTPR